MYCQNRPPGTLSRVKNPLKAIAIALLFAVWLPSAQAAILSWSGGGANNNWNDSGNWGFAGIPANGDTLVFPSGQPRLTNTNNISNLVLNQIRFAGGGGSYNIFGNAFTLTNNIQATNTAGINSISNNIVLSNVTVVVNVGGGATLKLNGALSGTVGLTKSGVGVLEFGGTVGNSYTGTTTITAGTNNLNKIGGNCYAGTLVVGDGLGSASSAVVRMLQATQIPSTDVTIEFDGLFDLNDFAESVSDLILQGGTARSGTNNTSAALTVIGAIFANGGDSSIEGLLSVSSGTRNIFFPVGTIIIGAPTVVVDAEITGSAYIAVSGNSGALFLNSSNSFTGPFSVGSSADPGLSVHLDNDFALGTTAGGTTNAGPKSAIILDLSFNNTTEPLTIGGNGNFGTDGALQITSGTGNWNTNVVLTSNTLINCFAATFLNINGGISGTGSLTKIGTGTMTFSGSPANNYAGATTNNAGTLRLDKTSTPAVPAGQLLVIGDALGGVGADVVLYLANNQIDSSSSILIKSTGLLDLNGFSESAIGAFTLDGGDIDTGTGSMTMSGNVTVPGSITNLSTIDGNVVLSGTRIFNVTNGSPAVELQINAAISGGALTKGASGILLLTASNSFTGTVTVNDGQLRLENDFAAGATNGGVVVNGDSVLLLNLGINVGNEPLTLNSTIANALQAFNGSNSWIGAVTLSTNASVYVDTADTLNFLGPISGPGGLTKLGTGTLYYSGSSGNSYAGLTTVNLGTLVLAKLAANASMTNDLIIGDGSGGVNADVVRTEASSQLPNTVGVTVNSSGLFDVTVGESFGSLAGSGSVSNTPGIAVGYDDTSTVFSGVIGGAGAFTKDGLGVMTLSGPNTYTGLTTVLGGQLLINGSQPQSPVTVGSVGILGGSGTVGNINNISGGVVAPGNSPGTLTSSNVVFSGATSDFTVELNGTVAGSGYDQLNVRGTNTLGGSSLNVLPNFTLGDAPQQGDQFVIINNDGVEVITGTFTGKADNSVFVAGNLNFRIDYDGGTGNDVVLTLTNVPAADGGTTILSGNGNGIIEADECALLNIGVSNRTGVAMTGVTASLRSITPGVSVMQGLSAYPDIPASPQRRTNSTPFQISVAPYFPCGNNIILELSLETATHSSFTIPVTVFSGSAGSAISFTNATVSAIPDGGTLNSTVTVSNILAPIAKVTVSLHITHASDADLDLFLESPDGTIVELSSDNGGGANYGSSCAARTTFDDASGTAITSGASPFAGTFRPEGQLVNFRGKSGADVNGTWTLRSTDDNFNAIAGSLQCWTLNIQPATCSAGGGACELCPDVVLTTSLGTNLIQTDRLFRIGIGDASSCGGLNACPGPFGGGDVGYDIFTFRNGPTNACITVVLDCPTGDIMSGAYSNGYNPASVCQNFLGYSGDSTFSDNPRTYSFNVNANSTFVIVVNEVSLGDGAPYTLAVSGGDCRPVLNISRATPTQFKLDWTTAATGYQLERTNAVINVTNWPPITNIPVVINSRFTVTNAGTPSNQFYRLRKPLP